MTGGNGTAPRAPFRILAVCTANICRSPAAEAYLRAALGPGVDVRSAGLHARTGEPVAPGMARLLDVPVDGFAARQLTPADVAGADLVLTMTREQRSAVVSTTPAAVRRTFALREFADLVALAVDHGAQLPDGPPEQRLAALVPLVPRYRGRRQSGDADDVEDPFGGDENDYARALLVIRDAVATLASAAAGTALPPHPVPSAGRPDPASGDAS